MMGGGRRENVRGEFERMVLGEDNCSCRETESEKLVQEAWYREK
jgi:hypothetical protein